MLYNLYAYGKKWMQPLNKMALLSHQFLDGHQLKGMKNLSRLMETNLMLLERDTRVYDRPNFGIDSVQIQVNGKASDISVSESVVAEKPFGRLIHFKKNLNGNQKNGTQPKIFVVAPLSGHYATLLRDTVKELLKGADVYLIDWENAKNVPLSEGAFTLDDYCDYVFDFLKILKGRSHVVAVCQPAVPVCMVASVMEEMNHSQRPLSLTLMGGPIDCRVNPSKVNEAAQSYSIDRLNRMVIDTVPCGEKGAGRRVCPGFFMLSGFMALDPKRHMKSYYSLYENFLQGSSDKVDAHIKFYDEYRAVMDLPAEYFLQTIKEVFQEYLLPKGEMRWRERLIKLENIARTPIFTIEGEKDNISPPGQTKAIHNLTPFLLQKKHLHQEGVGHYGIFSGRVWRSTIAPQILQFVNESELSLTGAEMFTAELIVSPSPSEMKGEDDLFVEEKKKVSTVSGNVP